MVPHPPRLSRGAKAMASEPSTPTPEKFAAPAERFRYRLRFAKSGDLRLVSHHDLMHCCERLFRRAATPVAFTQGFHPTPRMVFALSLPLGVAGLNEVLELELSRDLSPEELLHSLRQTPPPGLIFHNCRRIPWRLTGQPRRSSYRIPLPATLADLANRCRELLAQAELWMERDKPYHRRVNIRPFIESIHLASGGRQPPVDAAVPAEAAAPATDEDNMGLTPPARPGFLEFSLWVTPFGTAKPEEILKLLHLAHLPGEGMVLERTDLELIDEAGPDAAPVPIVDPRAIIAPLPDLPAKKKAAPAGREEPSRPHSLIEGPLSFET